MEVEIKFYAMLREATGKKREVVELPEKSSVGDLMDLLVGQYGVEFGRYIYDEKKQVRDYLSFMLNGINVNSLGGFNTVLRDGDVLAILPPVGGG
ncbi:MAG: ubiquitin-like small modifier protein 1 [Candidatus Bathyarchaeia archaeon]